MGSGNMGGGNMGGPNNGGGNFGGNNSGGGDDKNTTQVTIPKDVSGFFCCFRCMVTSFNISKHF